MNASTLVAPVPRCARCTVECPKIPGSITIGHGTDVAGNVVCYACCAEEDRKAMIACGHWSGYLTIRDEGGWQVSNWPGSLVFQVGSTRIGAHNFAGTRRDAWFNGPDGYVWHAVQIGDEDLCRCHRTKARAERPVKVVTHVR